LPPEPVSPVERLLALEGAVRVDEEFDLVADRLPGGVEPLRVALGLAGDLHLHARKALLAPAAELLTQPIERVRAKAAAAVERHRVVLSRQDVDQRQLEQARLQVPERAVDRGERHRAAPPPCAVPETA